jgi:HK97 family phage prohead protease
MSRTLTTQYAGVLLELSASEADSLDERGIPKQLGRQYRRAQIKADAYNADEHTVTLAVSSETPVQRFFGNEVLSHEKGALRTDRLKNGIALLFNHDYDAHLGRSQSWKLRDDGVLEVTNRFAGNPLAVEKEGDVRGGFLVDVSVGYVVHEWDVKEDKNGVRTYTAVDWEILENSLVTVPADPTVGAGRDAGPVKVRSFTSERDQPPVPDSTATRAADVDADEDADADDESDEDDDTSGSETSRTTQPPQQRTTTMSTTAIPAAAATGTDFAAENNARVAGLRALRTQYPANFTESNVLDAISSGTSVNEARQAVADAIIAGAQRTSVPTIGDDVTASMSTKERKSYSYVRTFRYAINQRFPGTFKEDAEAGFEREVSDQLAKEAGKRGLTVGGGLQLATNMPFNPSRAVQLAEAGLGTQAMQQRALTAGASTVGGAVINTVTETTPIELLRAMTVCLRLGATQLTGIKGLFRIPRQTSATTTNWLAESASGTNSDLALDDITFSPNRLNKIGSYTLELLNQEAFAVEDLLRMDQTLVEALSLDYAGLAGSGSNNVPLGLLNRSGLAAILTGSTRNQSTGAVTAGLGAVPTTYVDLNNAEAAISTANADEGGMAWAFTPRVRAAMRSTAKFPSGIMDPIWPGQAVRNARGLQEGPLGYQAAISTQLPSTLSFTPAGGSLTTGLHAWVLGYWPSLMFVDWGIRELIIDNITQAASGTYRIIENSLHDNNVRHIEHFAACQCAIGS